MSPDFSRSRFPDRLQLRPVFDPERLAADLRALANVEWTDHFVPQNYEGSWSAIPLRAPAGATHPILMIAHSVSATAYVDTPFLAQAPYLRAALNTFCCPLQAARLMRLAPGSTIKEHRDADLDIDYGFARLHVPIITNPDVGFFLNGRRIVMEPGSLWYLRLSDPHRVSNDGETDRVHLVVDAVANDWLAALFDEALVATGR